MSAEKLSEAEIVKRRDDALRRALSTPPQPTKKLVGSTERAQVQRETKALRKVRAKSKDA
ncbi:MAG: hypothetical protein H6872_08835 [Methylobacteriaceae bacterium]|nr:hypothetical protein [Rhodoblastus sp.]MCC0005237.1 hypothetical protein [Methylobacteriaceae bacterium]